MQCFENIIFTPAWKTDFLYKEKASYNSKKNNNNKNKKQANKKNWQWQRIVIFLPKNEVLYSRYVLNTAPDRVFKEP